MVVIIFLNIAVFPLPFLPIIMCFRNASTSKKASCSMPATGCHHCRHQSRRSSPQNSKVSSYSPVARDMFAHLPRSLRKSYDTVGEDVNRWAMTGLAGELRHKQRRETRHDQRRRCIAAVKMRMPLAARPGTQVTSSVVIGGQSGQRASARHALWLLSLSTTGIRSRFAGRWRRLPLRRTFAEFVEEPTPGGV